MQSQFEQKPLGSRHFHVTLKIENTTFRAYNPKYLIYQKLEKFLKCYPYQFIISNLLFSFFSIPAVVVLFPTGFCYTRYNTDISNRRLSNNSKHSFRTSRNSDAMGVSSRTSFL